MLKIGDKNIGTSEPAFIIAELSGNHNGKMGNAVDAIIAAKKAGADAIKLQTYTADTITIDSDKEYFQIKHGTIWDGTTLHALYQQAYTPWEWHAELFRVAKEEGIICFSSPFDNSAVDLLESLDAPAYKIASPEILDIGLIEKAAKTKKPIIISTGIATLEDISLAIETCKQANNNQVALLKCTVEYPAPLAAADLLTIPDMISRFGLVAGLSDHTMGFIAPVVAVSLGAKIIEKHFIVNRFIGGPDASFSMNAGEFAEMVMMVRQAEECIGEIRYKSEDSILNGRGVTGRSLFFVENIKTGEMITEKNVRSIRPGFGMHPKYLKELIGKKVVCDVERGTPVSWQQIQTQ
jgi:pseudaminic acid synthase